MKKQIGLLSLIAGTVAYSLYSFGDLPPAPIVSNVRMAQANNRLVTITYEVSGSPGIVTLDIQTNGVSIGAENIKFVDGDVNKEVEIGSHVITWHPDKSWQGHKAEHATAKVSVWNKSAPPDYMAVGLVPPYEKKWYTCEAALPQGIDSDLYRKNILLMRRVHRPDGGRWVMGSPMAGEVGRDPNREALHEVTLTNDYWVGVFEVTQKQWVQIKGEDSPAGFKGDAWATLPVEMVSYDAIRGKEADFHYPNTPAPNSFLGLLRKKTGIQSFDLPSEMQWEYACRAGTDTALNSGASVMADPWVKDPEMDKVGRYRFNGGPKQNENDGGAGQSPARVGSYLPNAWGLYDMHGNVWEWCLDWFTGDISGLDGQVNITSGGSRVFRGGSWGNGSVHCRSAIRFDISPSQAFNFIGFRLVCSTAL